MADATTPGTLPMREHLVHRLYEAAELEHNLMCTYLYAAFSLKSAEDGLDDDEARTVAGWRRTIIDVAIGEMGHLAAVWNITAALGAAPRFGRGNFPLDIGYLPAGVVVRLAPFTMDTLQHFIHLERPADSSEGEGAGFEPERMFLRGSSARRITPMALDYDTVGVFYRELGDDLRAFANGVGESVAFAGDPGLQLSGDEVDLKGAQRVICLKTALAAFDAIVAEGEGAQAGSAHSHYEKFLAIRREYATLLAERPDFVPSHRSAHNPVLRRPPRPEGRVWIEDPEAAATVDVGNAAYGLMLRLLAYTYAIPGPDAEKSLAIDLAIALMRAVTLLGERAARLPAGPSNPDCGAGLSFTALRDTAPFQPGGAARRFFRERLREIADGAAALDQSDARVVAARRQLDALVARADRDFASADAKPRSTPSAPAARPASTATPDDRRATGALAADGVEDIEGDKLTLVYEGRRCIHARLCVTGAPSVFLANVEGPWIHPDAVDVDRVVEIAHACPSGAIRYRRKDGHADESAPPVNLLATREAGPYAIRADIRLDGQPAGFRATLCRCGASKNKPFCDGTHRTIGFAASGEPESGRTDMLAARDGALAIDPEPDGPLQLRGNLEITSGTGRVVARVVSTRLCRCGGSANKPFCDGTHARIGFRS